MGEKGIVRGGVGVAGGGDDGHLVDRGEDIHPAAFPPATRHGAAGPDVDHEATPPSVGEEPVDGVGEGSAEVAVVHELPDELGPVVDGNRLVDASIAVRGLPDEAGGTGSDGLDRPRAARDLLNVDPWRLVRRERHVMPPLGQA